jgi:hypothetical protein
VTSSEIAALGLGARVLSCTASIRCRTVGSKAKRLMVCGFLGANLRGTAYTSAIPIMLMVCGCGANLNRPLLDSTKGAASGALPPITSTSPSVGNHCDQRDLICARISANHSSRALSKAVAKL